MFDLNKIPYNRFAGQCDVWIVYRERWFSRPDFQAWLDGRVSCSINVHTNLTQRFSSCPSVTQALQPVGPTLLQLQDEYGRYTARLILLGPHIADAIFYTWYWFYFFPYCCINRMRSHLK